MMKGNFSYLMVLLAVLCSLAGYFFIFWQAFSVIAFVGIVYLFLMFNQEGFSLERHLRKVSILIAFAVLGAILK